MGYGPPRCGRTRAPDGLEVYVTGGLGFNADFEEVFGDLDAKVLLVTVSLVVVLLLLIYRSPVIALIPLVVVGFAYTIARGLVYLYAESGATVSDNGATILVVLMFGVGTDYCLLLVSRYREELRRHEDKHEAMELAIRRTGPAILASGLTVALTMLVLLVATIGSTHSLGPVSAIGVTVAFTAGLTLLPALLTITGRRGFWPRHHVVDFLPEGGGEEREGMWRRLGQRVLQRPGAALGATLALFGIGCLGLLAYQEDYSVQNFFKKPTESADGFTVMQQAFPAGALVPTTVLVERLDGEVTDADIAAVREARCRTSTAWPRSTRATRARPTAAWPAYPGLRRRPVRGGRARARRGPARRRALRGAGRRARAGRRRERRAGRLQRGRRARPEADRPARPAGDLRDPRRPAAGARRAACC